MKIGRLLEFHQNYHSDISLSKNLGDGFLVSKNRLFRSVRHKTLNLGYSFSDVPNLNYLALPLSQLETILTSKILPYSDNVSVLFEIEKKIPNATVWDEVTDNLKKNYVFHEACHSIGRSYSNVLFSTRQDRDSDILRLLIEESFSNSCELLGIIDVEDNAHRTFYELNSYIFMYEDRTQLKKLVTEIGQELALQFLICCYLFSNFLHEKISESDYTTLLKLLKLGTLPNPVQKTLRSVSKIAFELNPRFRWVTTVFYLRLNGLSITTDELNRIDFLSLLRNDSRFLRLIDNLSRFETV